ncbi:hypothetical protein CLOM_g21225 [Closterium sp. NIES-68]|nr:hypothetical protein CLOM_g21225 [Closterium sp. NIES-68]
MWAIIQGVAMLLQNRYQRRRLYTRIALGEGGADGRGVGGDSRHEGAAGAAVSAALHSAALPALHRRHAARTSLYRDVRVADLCFAASSL